MGVGGGGGPAAPPPPPPLNTPQSVIKENGLRMGV